MGGVKGAGQRPKHDFYYRGGCHPTTPVDGMGCITHSKPIEMRKKGFLILW